MTTPDNSPFQTEKALAGFSLFLEFPAEVRKSVLLVMEITSYTIIPNSDQLYAAQLAGAYAETQIEWRYGDAADIFAHTIDPSFKGWTERKLAEENDDHTDELRSIFYQMIRFHDSDQIKAAVRTIRALGLVK